MVDVVGPHRPRIEVEAREVRHPHQVRGVGRRDHHRVPPAGERDRRRLYPRRPLGRHPLLIEGLAVHAVREPMHDRGPVATPDQRRVGDRQVVLDQLHLRDADRRGRGPCRGSTRGSRTHRRRSSSPASASCHPQRNESRKARNFRSVSSSSAAGSESATIPAPANSRAVAVQLSASERERPYAVAVASIHPTAPAYAPRGTGSSSAIARIASSRGSPETAGVGWSAAPGHRGEPGPSNAPRNRVERCQTFAVARSCGSRSYVRLRRRAGAALGTRPRRRSRAPAGPWRRCRALRVLAVFPGVARARAPTRPAGWRGSRRRPRDEELGTRADERPPIPVSTANEYPSGSTALRCFSTSRGSSVRDRHPTRIRPCQDDLAQAPPLDPARRLGDRSFVRIRKRLGTPRLFQNSGSVGSHRGAHRPQHPRHRRPTAAPSHSRPN